MTTITILGTGMAGLGAAYQASQENIKAILYDKNDHPGGHTASWTSTNGFVFDEGPHISFTKDERIKSILEESINGEMEEFSAYVNNRWQGKWIKHPAQCNLYGLPVDLVTRILSDFTSAQYSEPRKINNYAEWLVATYGKTFSETFPMEYGQRYHTVAAEKMSTDWLGPRLYRPKIEEILKGALTSETDDVHYVSEFRYPSKGGFAGFLNKLLVNQEVKLSHRLVLVNPKEKHLVFANNIESDYEHLVSSIPLPELIPMIDGVPDDVVAAAAKLACTICITVNLGIKRENISPAHWTYFYDRDYIFTRLSFPDKFSPQCTPDGCGSIQAEIYYSNKYKPVDRTPEECIEPVINDLRRCGLLREDDEILFKDARLISYANIIFDLERKESLEIVHGYLKDVNIHYVGRYGMWGYHWTDESFKSGESAVKKILK